MCKELLTKMGRYGLAKYSHEMRDGGGERGTDGGGCCNIVNYSEVL